MLLYLLYLVLAAGILVVYLIIKEIKGLSNQIQLR